MKPVIVIPRGLMSAKDIEKLNKNDFCVVEAKDPARVKFIDPIPAQTSRTQIEGAAIRLSRLLLNKHLWNSPDGSWNAENIAKAYVNLLIEGTPLSSRGTAQEQEQNAYNLAKTDEMAKIAREDARAEAKAKKEAAAKSISTKECGDVKGGG